ncbi:hypothetical protein D3C84_510320 [compost metagenome]
MTEGRTRAALCRGRLDDFSGDGAVALHDVARDLLVALIGGIGNHQPAVPLRERRRFRDRLVVVAADAHDLRAIGRNGRFALNADMGVQHDHAAAADALGRSGQRPAVVAVGSADHREAGQRRTVVARQQCRCLEAPLRKSAQDQAHQCDRRAERLEAAQHRALRLVLEQDVGHAQLRRQVGQRIQRRALPVQPRPGRKPVAALGGLPDTHDVAQVVGIGLTSGISVGNQHRGLLFSGKARPWPAAGHG